MTKRDQDRLRIYVTERCKHIRDEIEAARKKLVELKNVENPKAADERAYFDELIPRLQKERNTIRQSNWIPSWPLSRQAA